MSPTTTRTGIWFSALIAALVASLVDSNGLYFVAAFLAVSPLAARLFGLFSLRSLAVKTLAPVEGFAGSIIAVDVEIENLGNLPRFNIEVGLILPPGLEAEPQVEQQHGDDSSSQSQSVHTTDRPDLSVDSISVIAAEGSATAECRVRSRRRGCFHVGPVVITYMDPLELTRVRTSLKLSQEVLVYPTPLGVQLSPILGGDLSGSQRTSIHRGSVDGSDFYGIRPYRPGDEWRRIHWRTTARTGDLMVVEREALASLSMAIVLDLGSSPGDDDEAPLEVLIRLAAQLSEQAIRRSTALYILLLGREGGVAAATGRCGSLEQALAALGKVDPDNTPELKPIQELFTLVGPGPSLVLLTDRVDQRISDVATECRRTTCTSTVILYRPDDDMTDTDEERHVRIPAWRLRKMQESSNYYVEPLARL